MSRFYHGISTRLFHSGDARILSLNAKQLELVYHSLCDISTVILGVYRQVILTCHKPQNVLSFVKMQRYTYRCQDDTFFSNQSSIRVFIRR